MRNEIALAAHRLVFPHAGIPGRMAEDRERQARYYVALYAEMERCRVAQVPMLIGAGVDYGIPAAPRGVIASSDAQPKGGA